MKEKKKVYDYDTEIKDLSSLQEKKINVSVETISGFRNLIKINIDKSLINSNLVDKDEEIIFILLIKFNHPLSAPILYCLTKFSVPELSDGRDYLEEVLANPWIPKRKNSLKKLITLIPNFINNSLDKITKEKDLKIIGKYYLDNNYELNILKLFPHLYFGEIIEIVAFGNDKKVYDDKRIIMITEGFILLFVEKGIFESQKLKLIFWGPISSLSIIKQISNRNVLELKWKTKKDKTSLMRLKTEKYEQIFEILMDCLTKKKIEFKVANESSGTKKGEIPQIDIVAVEQEISKLEIKLKIKGKDGSNIENTKQLMNLYEKAVQYYSALNDYRYQIYMRKTKKLFSQMSDKDLGILKGIKKGKDGEKKKKGKKGKGKKEKEKTNKEKEEVKKEEDKKEIKKEEKVEDKKDEKIEEKKEVKVEEKKDEKVEEKKEEKAEEKKEEQKEEKVLEKKEEKIEEKKEKPKKVEENKEDPKKEEPEKEEPKKEVPKKKEETKKEEQKKEEPKKEEQKKEEAKKEDNKDGKSETRKKYEKSGFDLDLDDDE